MCVASPGSGNGGIAARKGTQTGNNATLPAFVPSQILVSVAITTPPGFASALAVRHRLVLLNSWPLALTSVNILQLQGNDKRSVADIASELRRESGILAVQPNYYYGLQGAQTAVMAQPQYALDKLDARRAHRISRGRGAIVAIVDTGIDSSHPDLEGSVIDAFHSEEGETPLTDPHGTEIAGLVSAHGVVSGVAPEAQLLDVQVFSRLPDGSQSAATTLSILRGLNWSASKGARVYNMSLAGPRDGLMEEAMLGLTRGGAIVVAAAGNDGPEASPVYPAAYDGVIAATATGEANERYGAANLGSYIAISAPGIDILAPAPGAAYRIDSGTSFAAAEVSGVVALMVSKKPDLTRDVLRVLLRDGALDLGAPGVDEQFGAGLVNAWKSLQNTGK